MEIRFATEADLPALISAQREVHEIHRQLYPSHYRSATDDELLDAMKEFLAADNNKAWIAIAEHGLAGYLLLKIETVPENAFCYARKEATVDNLGVCAGYQRRGIGRALTAEAIRYAVSQGCEELRLTVLASNTAACEFYNALGFDVFSQRLIKRL